jgi:hypothetical protein
MSLRRQSGQVMVLLGLSIVGLVALVALVLDGGSVYLQHRTGQAAADAAALAGTRALRDANSTTAVSSIASTVTTYAQANAFGVQPTVACATFVGTDGSVVGGIIRPTSGFVTPGCPTVSASIPSTAAGVHVDTHIAFQPYLIGMLSSVCGTFCSAPTADSHATGQVGVLTAYDTDNAPIIVCGGGVSPNFAAKLSTQTPVVVTTTPGRLANTPASLPKVNSGGPDTLTDTLLVTPATTPAPPFIADKTKDGTIYYVKGQFLGADSAACGDSGFKGEANPTQTQPSIQNVMGTSTPTIEGDTGNRVPQVAHQVATANGCGTDLTWVAGDPGCVMILPIADNSSGNTFYIGAWGAFYLWCYRDTGAGCQEYVAQYLANWDAPGGPSAAVWTFGASGGITVVHLIQ